MKTNKEIYIISYVGEYELKHSRLLIDIQALEDYNKQLYTQIMQTFDESAQYLYSISGTEEQLREYAHENRDYLFELLNGDKIGADDGHYDYFPDLVDQFRQLCKQTNQKHMYNRTIDKLKGSNRYYDDEEIVFERL